MNDTRPSKSRQDAEHRHATGGAERAVAVLVLAGITGLYLAGVTLTVRAGQPHWANTATGLAFYAFPAVGTLIALRRPRNRIAWLCLLVGSLLALETALWGAALYGFAHPGAIPRPDLLAVIADPLPLPGIFLIATLLVLMFPDGHLPSPRWRWLVWLSVVSIAGLYLLGLVAPDTSSGWGRPTVDNPIAVEAFDVLEPIGLVPFLCVAGSLVALVRRYRRSSGIERLQFRWLRAAGVATIVIWLVAVFVLEPWLGYEAALIATSSFVLVPAAIGFSVMRYRLYEIDRLISRTVTYGLVLTMLTGVFAGGVLLAGWLLPTDSEVAVAAATLTVAAGFNPLRRRVQARVDHRFNRARYDADREVARYASRLRSEVDLDQLTAGLLAVVTTTMQPTTATLWVRDDR
jgi:hypothetical protein